MERHGTIKWIGEKGASFIKSNDKLIYANIREFNFTPLVGQEVTFIQSQSILGLKATNINLK